MKTLTWFVIAAALAWSYQSHATATKTLDLPFDGSVVGAQGEIPLTSVNIAYQPGVKNQALWCQVGTKLEYPTADNLSATEGTLMLWLRPAWNGNDGQTHFILVNGEGGGMVFQKDGASALRAIFNRYGENGLPEMGVAINVGSWAANEWHHIAYTWSKAADELVLYVDGELAAFESTAVDLPEVVSSKFQLTTDGFGGYLQGDLDMLRVYDGPLSAGEIAAAYFGDAITAVTIEPSGIDMVEGLALQLTAAAQLVTGRTQAIVDGVAWSVADEGIASVSSSGLLVGLSTGSTTVSATYLGVEGVATVDVAVAPPTSQNTIISSDSSGVAANGSSTSLALNSQQLGVSANGRWIVFTSDASNLVENDTNGVGDIFVKDRTTGATTRVSVSSTGEEANGRSLWGTISADGRLVSFASNAANLVAGDSNGARDCFVHDRLTGVTELVSLSSEGVQAEQYADQPCISGDGRYVTFASAASNLDPALPPSKGFVAEIFLRDRMTATTTLVTKALDGNGTNSYSEFPRISADGSTIVFDSYATDLTRDPLGSGRNVFAYSVTDGTTELISKGANGAGADGESLVAYVSGDGRLVAFMSHAHNLVDGPDVTTDRDVFVHDRESGQTVRASVNSKGDQVAGGVGSISISSNGRYVTFRTEAPNAIEGVGGGIDQMVRHDLVSGETILVSAGLDGPANGNCSFTSAQSHDGAVAVFAGDATNLVPFDLNGFGDVFATPMPIAPAGDLDGDGMVDGADLGLVLGAWGTTNAAADLNGDGTVDGADLGILLGGWT